MLAQYVQEYAPLILALLVGLTFHEFAHAWTAYKLGDPTAYREGRVTLNPLMHLDPLGTLCILITGGFGWARPVPVNPYNLSNPRRDDFWITAAGPISNVILAVLAGLIFGIVVGKAPDLYLQFASGKASPGLDLFFRFLRTMVFLNFALAFFNLLPIFPLDGSHIVKNILPPEQGYRFEEWGRQYGFYVLIGLILIGRLTGGRIDPFRKFVYEPTFFFTQKVYAYSLYLFR